MRFARTLAGRLPGISVLWLGKLTTQGCEREGGWRLGLKSRRVRV